MIELRVVPEITIGCPLGCNLHGGWIKVPYPIEQATTDEPRLPLEDYKGMANAKAKAWVPCPFCHPDNVFEGKGFE